MEDTQNTESLTIEEQLQLQQEALAKIYKSVEKTRKIMFWTGIANLALFVLPLLAALLLLPTIMNTFSSSLSGFSQVNTSQEQTTAAPSLSESLNNLQNLGF